MKLLRTFLLPLILLVCAPLQALGGGGAAVSGAAVTWREAWIRFPAGFAGLATARTVKSLQEAENIGRAAVRPWPTVVYIHGCKGHGRSSRVALKVLAGAGFVVIAPDSFARAGRPQTCDPSRHRNIKGAPHRDVTQMRLVEIDYAAQAALKLKWVDPNNLFLYGHSQGGRVAAQHSADGFKAVATSGTRCPGGVGAPGNKPGLYMNAARDPWFHGKPPPGKCRTGSPAGSVHEHPVFDSDRHLILGMAMARTRLTTFFQALVD